MNIEKELNETKIEKELNETKIKLKELKNMVSYNFYKIGELLNTGEKKYEICYKCKKYVEEKYQQKIHNFIICRDCTHLLINEEELYKKLI